MEKFQVLKLHDEPYDFLVIATSYENPLSLFDDSEKQLGVDDAKILFDLTLINGVKKNRYVKCHYKAGMNSHLSSCSIVDNINDYINCPEPYYGATIGRFANRIAKGKFILEGIEYTLAQNNTPNHLHGGVNGFHNVVWNAVRASASSASSTTGRRTARPRSSRAIRSSAASPTSSTST